MLARGSLSTQNQMILHAISGAYLVTPNLSELKAATSIAHDDDETLKATAGALSKTHDIANILTTLSARGMRLDVVLTALFISRSTKDVFDVSGAGDTVVASLACALAAGETLPNCYGLCEPSGKHRGIKASVQPLCR